MKLLFVVHRFYPYSGGSEINVYRMADALSFDGHDITVLTDTHKGDINQIRVTSDKDIIFKEKWDCIIVHGAGAGMQDYVHSIDTKCPILYLLIFPNNCSYKGLQKSKYIGYGTTQDYIYLCENGFSNKAFPVRYGAYNLRSEKPLLAPALFKNIHDIKTKKMFISIGGFAPNKCMNELYKEFISLNLPDTTLCLTGYWKKELAPPETNNVRVFTDLKDWEIFNAIKEADLLIMNSNSEGYGLVLLEAMVNYTQWAARMVGGAYDLQQYGFTYKNIQELTQYLKTFEPNIETKKRNYSYVVENHSPEIVSQYLEDIITGKQVVIDLGSGPHPKPDATIHVDINTQFPHIEVEHDIRITPYPFQDNSADKIYLGDVLEYIYIFETEKVLREIFRILKPGGVVEITVPNMKWIAERILKKDLKGRSGNWLNRYPTDFINLMNYVYGGALTKDEYQMKGMAHVMGFDRDTLIGLLYGTGFSTATQIQETKQTKEMMGAILKVIAVK